MTHLQTFRKTCPPCGPFAIDSKDLGEGPICVRCGKPKGGRHNKYNAVKKKLDGYLYDSQFEGNYAAELSLRLKAGDILKWERQVQVAIYVRGNHILTTKVDFLIHHKDGSKELVEVKGKETREYQIIKRLIEAAFLPEHPEYSYTVVKQDTGGWRNFTGKRKRLDTSRLVSET